MKIRISDHFTLKEVTQSQTAARKGIDNALPDDLYPNAAIVAESLLEPVRAYYGIPFSPSSWYRCLELNRAIGSRDRSQHVRAQAVDFEIPGISNIEVAKYINDELQYDQLILEFYKENIPNSGWIHVSYRSLKENRMQALVFDGKRFKDFA